MGMFQPMTVLGGRCKCGELVVFEISPEFERGIKRTCICGTTYCAKAESFEQTPDGARFTGFQVTVEPRPTWTPWIESASKVSVPLRSHFTDAMPPGDPRHGLL